MSEPNGSAPATQADLAVVRSDFAALGEDFATLGGDFTNLRGDFAALRGDFANLRGEMVTLRVEMMDRIEHVETTLLKEFRKWAVRNDSTLRVHDARSIGYDQRLSVLEERVAELEDR